MANIQVKKVKYVIYTVHRTVSMHWLKQQRNSADVQSSFLGETISCSRAGIGVGTGDDPGYNFRKFSI